MLPAVERLSISLFDVHLWKGWLDDPASFAPTLQFLRDPTAYRDMRLAGSKVELGNLRIFPLRGELEHNHFWRRYAEAAGVALPGGLLPAAGEPREWLLPLRCRPTGLALTFDPGAPAPPAAVRATIWLWPFGWSSHLEIALRAPLEVDDLRAITATLRSGGTPPFVQAGARKGLSDVLKGLTQQLRSAIGGPGKLPPDSLAVARRMVVAAVCAKGAPRQRYGTSPADLPRFSDSERGRLHGALLGRAVPPAQLIEWEGKRSFVLSNLLAANFALTHIDEGTLILLGHPADVGGGRDRQRCLAANMRSCWLATTMLARLIGNGGAQPPGGGAAAVVASAAEALAELKTHYKNPLCWSLIERYQH